MNSMFVTFKYKGPLERVESCGLPDVQSANGESIGSSLTCVRVVVHSWLIQSVDHVIPPF